MLQIKRKFFFRPFIQNDLRGSVVATVEVRRQKVRPAVHDVEGRHQQKHNRYNVKQRLFKEEGWTEIALFGFA